MTNSGRPLSPHLSVYRWPITMVLSILHRMTGVAMSLGLIVFAAWLMQAAAGPEAYLGFIAFFFHVANGVRHLVWDTGRGFEKQQANRSAWFVVLFAVVATAIFWGSLS
jgi:succinate dehydrogenase / fumarate reductase cytochrome b subunit